MIDVRIIPATEEHLQMILPDVRQADIDELYAVSLMTTEDALRVGLRTATMAWSGFANGELVTMFGVSPASMIGGNGTPWLVGTSRIEKYQKTFLRHCRPVLQQMLAVYPRLENYVDTGLDSGLKKPRLMVLLVLISTDFTWRENNVRSGYCWWRNARHEWHSGIHPVPTGKVCLEGCRSERRYSHCSGK